MKNEEDIKTGFENELDKLDERYKRNYQDKYKVIPTILNLFEIYEGEIYTPSTIDKERNKLQLEIRNKLQEKCTQEQNELIDQFRYCIASETSELVETSFLIRLLFSTIIKRRSQYLY